MNKTTKILLIIGGILIAIGCLVVSGLGFAVILGTESPTIAPTNTPQPTNTLQPTSAPTNTVMVKEYCNEREQINTIHKLSSISEDILDVTNSYINDLELNGVGAQEQKYIVQYKELREDLYNVDAPPCMENLVGLEIKVVDHLIIGLEYADNGDFDAAQAEIQIALDYLDEFGEELDNF